MHDMDLYTRILCLMNILEASKIQPYDRNEELVGPKAKSKHVENEVDHGAVGGPNLDRVGYFCVHLGICAHLYVADAMTMKPLPQD